MQKCKKWASAYLYSGKCKYEDTENPMGFEGVVMFGGVSKP